MGNMGSGPVTTNVRFGSLAALVSDISSMSASGGKADIQTSKMLLF